MSERVLLSVTDGVADVRLNRQEKLNAIDGAMMDAIIGAQQQISQDSHVRVAVVSGIGRGFSAGLDTANFADMASGELDGESESVAIAASDLSPGGAARPQQIGWGWRELAVPVIAAVHGPAMGAGLHIALGADIRHVSPDVRLAFVEVTWGLVPDLSAIQSLRRLVPLDVLTELIMTGREIDGVEAVRLGLATTVSDDPRASALELAAEVAAQSPDAIRALKQLALSSALVAPAEGLASELAASLDLMGTPNQIEAVMAKLEGRPPRFTD